VTGPTSCAHCGTAIPLPTGRAARRRYCSDPCRKAAWRHRHRDRLAVGDIVPNVVPGHVVVPTASRDDLPTPGSGHRCPHCRQPLAIISVLIPAGAATVHPPEVPMTTN
jgi:predicted nucleic acid-binding Zn ribbon protein